MTETKQETINAFKAKIGEDYTNWYVGITNNPMDMLYTKHKVEEKADELWIAQLTSSYQIAKEIEEHFVKLGAKSVTVAEDETAKWIYAYKATEYTSP